MTVGKGLAAGLIFGPACCWAFTSNASAQNAATTMAPTPTPTLELQQVTVTANFIRPGGQSALKMNVPVKDVPFALVDYSQAFMKAVDTTQLTDLYGYMSGVQRAGPSGYDITIRGFTSSSTDPNRYSWTDCPDCPRYGIAGNLGPRAVEIVKGPSSCFTARRNPAASST